MFYRVFALSFCLFASLYAQQASATQYTVTPLGILPGGVSSAGWSIDVNGDVVGYTTYSNNTRQATYWPSGGAMLGLGGTNSTAVDISAGNIVGQSGDRAFRWTAGPGLVLLDPANSGFASSVISNGTVIGNRYVNPVNHRAQIWSASNVLSSPFPSSNMLPRAMNEHGQYVGQYSAFGFYVDEFGAITNQHYIPFALSDTGVIAGYTQAIDTLAVYGHSNTNAATIIGALPGDTVSRALGIDPLGTTIVGESIGRGGFVFDITTSTLESLTSLLAPDFSGWSITTAYGVNDNGQIAGTGIFNGQQRAVLLTPIPEPSSFALLGIGLVCAFAARRSFRR